MQREIQDQSNSNKPDMKTTTIWSIEDPGEKIHHDSVSRFREMIILITSLVPSRI